MPEMTRTTFLMFPTTGAVVIAEERLSGDEYNMVEFTSVSEDEFGTPIHELQLNERTWEDMGSPGTITVAIEPGDKLNA